MIDDARSYVRAHAGNPELGVRTLARFEKTYREHAHRAHDWSPPAAALLARLFGNSHALAERLVAHPEWADAHAADPFASAMKPRDIMKTELDAMLDGLDPADEDSIGRILRQYKYREMIRIVVRDLAGTAPVEESLREWSALADVLIAAAYRTAHDRLSRQNGLTCAGCIIALGKLGGSELNYSSDVDLLIIYERDEQQTGAAEPHEFYVRLAGAVTRLLSNVTDEGFVFRVDHELRPEGIQGTLANSLDAAERYYEHFGRDWERQALIRARPVAGDKALGQAFIERMRPFVFRRTLGIEDLKSMKRMKERMTDAARDGDAIDVKHGKGGIRSVEFLVQALQMIYGGRSEALQTTNTFRAIDALTDEHLIHPTSGSRLKTAYAFLRRVENMLQLAREQQVHRLPTSHEDRTALARRLGFVDGGEHDAAANLLRELAHIGQSVQPLFEGMFEADYERIELIEAIEANLASCSNEEEIHDSIPWFKHQEFRRIQHLDLSERLSLQEILARLTLVAEVVITTARKLAWKALTARYGMPCDESGQSASFAVIGLGKLGGAEIDYGSDLDLCFIYSADGRTDGERPVDNREFFARLAQRIISLITTSSRYGRAYEVDSELRPSGQSGMLVSTQRAFLDYHLESAQAWERMAMLRARVIDGHEPFVGELRLALEGLSYEIPPPNDASTRSELMHIRQRVARERARDDDTRFSIKHARGGSDDLDAIIQYRQLMNVAMHPSLRTQNTFRVTEALRTAGLLDEEEYASVRGSMEFYRMLLSRIRLLSGRATDLFDTASPQAEAIASQMKCPTIATLREEIMRHRHIVSGLFDRTFGA